MNGVTLRSAIALLAFGVYVFFWSDGDEDQDDAIDEN
jgi:hypothetical protein